MALSIKTAEADELARELAKATNETLTEAVTIALRERLVRVLDRQDGASVRLARLAEEYASLPRRDERSLEEVLGYDEAGLPT